MFESEVQNILFKRQNTLELIEKLNAVYAPYEYGQPKYDHAYGISYRIESPHTINRRAVEDMKNILQFRDIKVKADEKATLEELAEIVKATTIDDFYFSMCEYFPYHREKEYEIGNMQFKESRVHDRKLILILNCIWLLEHDAPIESETSHKIYKLAKEGETFIFCGCKVTRYKNGNLKIQFSNAKLYTDFENRFYQALEKAVREAEKRAN